MSLAYLVNQYPHVSHTFIRREILAQEAAGMPVMRYSVRPGPVAHVNPGDIAEASRTHVILHAGWLSLLRATLLTAVTRPASFFRALACTWQLGRQANRRLRSLAYLVEACWLARDAAHRGVTHIHAHFGTNPTSVALLCHLLGGPTYSFTVHGPEEFDQPISLSLGKKIEHAKFVVGVSEFGRSQLSRWCPHAQWSKLHVIHCGVDAEFLNSKSTPALPTRRFVCVGRLCEQKGQLVLVEAFSRLHQESRDVQLILVGDGEMRPEITELIRWKGLESAVQITGWMNNSDVRAEIESSLALVLPSFAEGLPVVIMEAFAVGRPVISTYIAGIPELVRDRENGRLVPAGDVAALTEAMRDLLACSASDLQRMGAHGNAAVRARHDAAFEAGRLRELFAAMSH